MTSLSRRKAETTSCINTSLHRIFIRLGDVHIIPRNHLPELSLLDSLHYVTGIQPCLVRRQEITRTELGGTCIGLGFHDLPFTKLVHSSTPPRRSAFLVTG
ncbi:SGT1-plant-like protein [Sesbania bispinosa]|nr:SGT1-plant-like protein [Sesbania bispinosa]